MYGRVMEEGALTALGEYRDPARERAFRDAQHPLMLTQTRRVAVVSGSDRRDEVVRSLINAGVDCSPTAVGKDSLPLADFVRRPELFRDFVQSLMPDTGALKTAVR